MVENPGENFSISELKVNALDSLSGYPKKYEYLMSYVLVKRNNNPIPKKLKTTLSFDRKYSKYKWKVLPDPFLADYYYVDTIKVKTNVWYEIGCANCNFNLYYYWDSSKDKEIVKRKSYPEGPY